MRKLIIIILGLFSVAYGQKYQSMPQAGYGPVKRMQFDSVVTLPMGITRLRNLSDGRDSGQVRYNPSDSSLYVYTGRTWVRQGGGGGGSTDSTVYATHYYVDSSIGSTTMQKAFNASIGTDPAIDGGGNPLVMNNLGYTEITANDDININAGGSYGSAGMFGAQIVRISAGDSILLEALDSIKVNSDIIFRKNGAPAIGKVPTGTDGVGNWTWQTPTTTDTSSLSNRINAKASISGATFTGRVRLQGVDISKDSIPIVSNKQWVMFIDTATGRVSRQIDIDNEPIVSAIQALGSNYKATTVGVDVSKIAAAAAINANTVYYMVTWIPNDTTITGVAWYQTVAGNYTASGYNGVGLYSYSAGTWTLVASSTNDNNIWTATANTYATKDFTTPYRASKGVYAIAFTYNRSAVTTAPTIARGGVLTNASVSSIGTNSAKLYSSSSGSSLPSSITASSQTTVNTPYFLALY